MATREKAGDARVVLLTGEEFQRLERFNELLRAHVDQATLDFNFNSLYPQDLQKFADVRRFADLVMAYPMMAERRVVAVRFFDDIPAEVRKKLAEALKDTPETTLVIIEGEKGTLTPKPPERYFRHEPFKPIYENKLPGWIRERFARREKRVSESAIVLLMNNVGIVPLELDAEIGKITDMMRDKSFITEEDVERIVGKFRRFTVYALQNAVGMGDFAEAARVLRNLMETEKGRETWYVMSLATHIMKLGQYNTLIQKGASPADALKELGEPDFLWKVNHKDIQARNFKDPDKVRRALEVLANADSQLKRSSVDKAILMELVLPAVMP